MPDEPLPMKAGQTTLWKLIPRPFAKQRRENRLMIPMEVLVETMGANGDPEAHEHTVTEMISSLGACFPSSLDVGVGRVLKISSLTDHVSIFAAVRSRELASDGIPRLGVEFIGDRWPLQRDAEFTYQKAS